MLEEISQLLPASEPGVEPFCIHRLKSTSEHSAIPFAKSGRGISIELTVGEHGEIHSSFANVDTNRVTCREHVISAHAFKSQATGAHVSKHGFHERLTLLSDRPLSRGTFGHNHPVTR